MIILIREKIRLCLRQTKGGAGAEFAMVLPIFLLLIFGSIALAVMMYMTAAVQDTVASAARCMSAEPTVCTQATIDTYAKQRYTGPAIKNLTFKAEALEASSAGSCRYKIVASGTFEFFAGLGMLTVPINTSACYPAPV